VWFGAALVLGLPSNHVVGQRILGFVINLVTISGSALVAYAGMNFREGFSAPRSGLGVNRKSPGFETGAFFLF
jgi:hypothetical protein